MRKGFTLIELMIVVAIVSILVTIAYPSYRDYTTRGRRSDAKMALLDLSTRMERYYSQQNSYLGATVGTGAATDVRATNTSPEGWYRLTITALTPSSYTLTATPLGAQATDDKRCQTLTYNNLGLKGVAAGPTGAPTDTAAQCW